MTPLYPANLPSSPQTQKPALAHAAGPAYVLIFLILALIAALAPRAAAAAAAATVLPGGTAYSYNDIVGFFKNSNNSYLSQNAQYFAQMSANVEDTNGNTGTYNGSCCTGLMQMNNANIATYCGCTQAQFAALSGQQQINIYSQYFSAMQNSGSMQTLMSMQQNGQSLGGYKVTPQMLVACAQLGAGNCQAAINNGCSSVALGQGGDGSVNVCTMAEKAANGSNQTNNGSNNNGSNNNGGNNNGGNNGTANNSTQSSGDAPMTRADINGSYCWACEAASKGFSIMNGMFTAIPQQLAAKTASLFAIIWAIVIAIKIATRIFMPAAMAGGPQELISSTLRFIVIITVVTWGTLYTDIVQEYALAPAIGLGGYLGNQILTAAMSAFGVSS